MIKKAIFCLAWTICNMAFAGKPVDPATYIPEKAKTVIPVLRQVQTQYWADNPYHYLAGGQAEQESCVSLTSSRCWDTHSELKTSREYGFGLFQTTIAYNADGSTRFNNFNIVKAQFPELHSWQWDDRYDMKYQMTAYVLTMKKNYESANYAKDPWQRSAFAEVTYNSGSVLKDRTLCAHTKGCDPNVWYGNVELHSYKSNKVLGEEYGGQSALSISRTYPKNIQYLRGPKYAPLFGEQPYKQ